MKLTYESPEAKLVCFAPVEGLASIQVPFQNPVADQTEDTSTEIIVTTPTEPI